MGRVNDGVVGDDPVTLVYLCLEVAGCPTVCRHCWAQGTGYGMMPLADIEWVLARAHEYCDGRGLGFDSYPMHGPRPAPARSTSGLPSTGSARYTTGR